MHEYAIILAYDAGREADDLNNALVYEAGGQHFLTDAFSAGHLRTSRASAQRYWSAVYPSFGNNLLAMLGDLIGDALFRQQSMVTAAGVTTIGGPGALVGERQALIHAAAAKAKKQLGSADPPNLGATPAARSRVRSCPRARSPTGAVCS